MAWPSRWPDGIVADELVTAAWLDDVSTSLAFLERVAAATDVTSDVVVDVTTTATSALIIALPATTYEAVPHYLVAEGPAIERTQSAVGAAGVVIGLYDGAAANHMGHVQEWTAASTNSFAAPFLLKHTFTPTAASHTYQIRAHCTTADSFTWRAGAGGAATRMPIKCSIYKIPVGS